MTDILGVCWYWMRECLHVNQITIIFLCISLDLGCQNETERSQNIDFEFLSKKMLKMFSLTILFHMAVHYL